MRGRQPSVGLRFAVAVGAISLAAPATGAESVFVTDDFSSVADVQVAAGYVKHGSIGPTASSGIIRVGYQMNWGGGTLEGLGAGMDGRIDGWGPDPVQPGDSNELSPVAHATDRARLRACFPVAGVEPLWPSLVGRSCPLGAVIRRVHALRAGCRDPAVRACSGLRKRLW